MKTGSTLIDRCVIGVDVQAYSQRNPRRQRDTQRDLQELLTDAAGAAGLDRSAWTSSHTGDGELAVLPADVNLLAVLGSFVPELDKLLVLRNEDRVPETKIRLRVAVHIDALTPSTDGHYAGRALVVVSRLLDAQAVRDALERADRSELALIVSSPFYEKVVLSGLLPVRENDFVPVEVVLPSKAFRHTARLHVPGYDMQAFVDGRSPTEAAGRAGARAAPGSGLTVVQGNVVHGGIASSGSIAVGGDLDAGADRPGRRD